MFTMLRIYSGMPGAGARVAARKDAVEKLLRAIPGFAGYRLIATSDGMASVTICETQAGCEESAKAAAVWLREHMPDLAPHPPEVVVGESLVSFGAKPQK